MKFLIYYNEHSSYNGLKYLLDIYVPAIGDENEINKKNNIKLFKSDTGSYRYVKYINDNPISAIQIMSKDGKNAYVANAYTLPEYRKSGYARELMRNVEKDFETVIYSDDLSDDGKAFVSKMKSYKE